MKNTLADVIATTTPSQAWEGWVGNQSSDEFWTISRQEGHVTIEAAAAAYAKDLPEIFSGDELLSGATPEQLQKIADLLAEDMHRNLDHRLIYADTITIGRAYEEGRAPSHDGEYLTVYYTRGSDDYIVTDNGGVAWTSYNWDDVRNDIDANADPEDVEEFERQLDEVERIMREQTGELVESMSPAAAEIASEWGWVVPQP